ncbi:glycosyltransferase family 2 protein [Robertkochia solimangrovi]|uniref:glycosyltransferase family 2 protein n=1 Tax=Robertkochia solimangrovi TaxID=2213046 RepID=UPI001180F5DE|nr:glycosyltransferase family 2 protein [Robertkochia solimangrovi]TRZ45006.1 hypothetical protein DMZ48_04385 [Robertkochia solimangrovi]
MRLSIIIPVKNVASYIDNCIRSIYAQKIAPENFEVILIDDGSVDQTLNLCKSYAKIHSNIMVITQSESGVGLARNKGLDHASGRYIYFMDGDDYLARNTLGAVLKAAEESHADIAGFRTIQTSKANLFEENSTKIKGEKFSGNGIYHLAENPNYRVEIWWYIIRKEFLINTGLRFEERRFVNDSYFTPKLFLQAENMIFLNKDVHRYLIRGGSTTKSNRESHLKRHINDSLYAIEQMNRLMAELEKEEDAEVRLVALERINSKRMSYAFFTLIRFCKSNGSILHLNRLLVQLKQLEAYPITGMDSSEHQGIKYKVLTNIMNNKFLLNGFIKGLRPALRIINRN